MVQHVEEIRLDPEVQPLVDGEDLCQVRIKLTQARQDNLSDACIAERTGRRSSESTRVQPLLHVTTERAARTLGIDRLPRYLSGAAGAQRRSSGIDGVEGARLIPVDAGDHEPADDLAHEHVVALELRELIVHIRHKRVLAIDVQLAVVVAKILPVGEVAAIR